MVGYLFGCIREEEEEYDYDCILIDDSCAQGDDKKIIMLEKTISNMCKDVVIEMELM